MLKQHIMNNDDQIKALQEEIAAKYTEIRDLRRANEPIKLKDYRFKDLNGNTKLLSELFQGKDELMLIQNMGKKCPYCTLWADGFNGVYHHLENRMPFAVVSPDDWETAKAFSESRSWKFKLLSSNGTDFKSDTHFANAQHGTMPGVIVLKKKGDEIFMVSRDYFGPGDPYCGVWHLYNLIPEGANNWAPKFAY